ncbi:MAG: exo-beta-N-acetylmuramidase NamZ domain-containing protein [Paludibacteraceae bacterium]
MTKRLLIAFLLFMLSLPAIHANQGEVILGAERTDVYFPLIQGKNVALLSNHTGVAGGIHTLDRLIEAGMHVTAIFSPEHGFRGSAGAGDKVGDSVDEKTGVPILSLYDGKRMRPSDEAMRQFDVLIVDIQDVGLRFYTYYITMCRMMQACAEYNKLMIILDRPNPNGFYVDGPILDMKYKSGVGWLPIPVVHGMTLGELALMVNGEHWLDNNAFCPLTVVPCANYTHQTRYRLPIAPSPNLQNMLAIYLYPSTCYFEATPVSLGRGTDKPFLQYGHPHMQKGKAFRESNTQPATFTPKSCPAALTPPQQDRKCFGTDLSNLTEEQAMQKGIDLSYLIDAYQQMALDNWFFSAFFEKLIGVSYVRKMIIQGKSAEEIRATWAEDVAAFRLQRKPYLLYEE